MQRFLGLTALVSFGFAVAVVLAEVLVRVADPHARDHALPAGFFTIDADLGWRQRAGRTVSHETRYFSVDYTTNAEGYRDVDRSHRARSDRTRIVLFGDSQVLGWGVSKARRFSDLLEARHPEIEVWNRAVMGYGLDQQLLDYERTGGEWDADAVVLFASVATLGRLEMEFIYRKHKPRFILDTGGALRLVEPPANRTTLTSVAYRLLSPWYLPYFLDRRIEAVRTGLGRPPALPHFKPTPDGRVTPLTVAVLGRAADVARTRGHRLMVLTDVPEPMSASLRQAGAQLGIPVLTAEYAGESSPFILGPEDRHWNPRGHERVAGRFWEQWVAMAKGARTSDARPQMPRSGT